MHLKNASPTLVIVLCTELYTYWRRGNMCFIFCPHQETLYTTFVLLQKLSTWSQQERDLQFEHLQEEVYSRHLLSSEWSISLSDSRSVFLSLSLLLCPSPFPLSFPPISSLSPPLLFWLPPSVSLLFPPSPLSLSFSFSLSLAPSLSLPPSIPLSLPPSIPLSLSCYSLTFHLLPSPPFQYDDHDDNDDDNH